MIRAQKFAVANAPASSTSRWTLAASVLLAWLGLVIHNRTEFPHMAFTSPEYGVATLIWLALLLARLWSPNRSSTRLLFGWGAISLGGAILTVLPLPILPFRPEQSLRHYVVHVIYAVTQLPALWLTWRMRD
jgi:hypothetical protein